MRKSRLSQYKQELLLELFIAGGKCQGSCHPLLI